MNLALICFNPAFRDSLQKILSQISGFSIRFEGRNVFEFISSCDRCDVDVLIIDDYTAQQNTGRLETLISRVQCGILILTDPGDRESWDVLLNDTRFRILNRDSRKKEFESTLNRMYEQQPIIHL